MTYPTEDYHFLVPSKPPLEPIEDVISRFAAYRLLDHTQLNPVDLALDLAFLVGDETGPAQGVLPKHRYHLHDHTKADDPNKPIWAWDAKLKQYRHLASGKIIGGKRMLELRDIYTDRQALRAEQLVEQLVRGEISLQDWLLAQRQLIKETYIAQYAMARGGRSQMTPQDYGRLGADLKKQYAYLQAFGQDIQSGKYRSAEPANLIARITNRIKLYIESATQAFEKGKIAVFGGNLYDHITNFPGAGKTRCLTRCRCHLDVTESETEWLVRWVLDPAAEHCEDCVSLSEQWNPLRVAKPKSILKAAGGPVSSGVFMFERDSLETFIPGKAVIVSPAGTYHDSATGKFTSKPAGSPPRSRDPKERLIKHISDPDMVEEVSDRFEDWFGNDQAVSHFVTAFEYHDPETGLESRIEGVNAEGLEFGVLRVEGGIYDGDKKVGRFTKAINGPRKMVKHELMELDDSYQQHGFGGRYYRNAEASYERAGVKQVKLEANLIVGGYAWARMGFSATDEDLESLQMVARSIYRKRYGDQPEADLILQMQTWELAALTGPDGGRIGKEALLGSGWSGLMKLEKNDPGYQAGELYIQGGSK